MIEKEAELNNFIQKTFIKIKTMNYTKLYLDDLRTPRTEGWVIVRNYEDFVDWITENGVPDEISFDHDLGEDEAKEKVNQGINKKKARAEKKLAKTGYDCAKWLCNYCYANYLPLPKWNVHSANPVGAQNIKQLLETYERKFSE